MKKNMKKFYSAALAMLVTLLLPVVVLAAGKEIIILHTNDIHCGITDNLGIDKVSQYKKDLKKQGYPVALVDAGDAIQGAPIGKLSTGESIVKIMNAVGYMNLITVWNVSCSWPPVRNAVTTPVTLWM